MASNTETGHAVNIDHFKLLHDKCAGFGGAYNPSNPTLTVANLLTLWNSANSQQSTLNMVLANAKEPINQRKLAFDPLNKLVTRTLNSLRATSANAEVKKDAKGLADKIRGHKVKKPAPTPPDDPANPDPDWVSNSHQSYVQIANYFEEYIDLLASVSVYAPNEPELTVVSLNTLLASLQTHNNNMGATVIAPMEQTRIARNHILYDAETGLVDIALKVKDYVKSVFGTTAPETKTVTGIKFSRPKK